MLIYIQTSDSFAVAHISHSRGETTDNVRHLECSVSISGVRMAEMKPKAKVFGFLAKQVSLEASTHHFGVSVSTAADWVARRLTG